MIKAAATIATAVILAALVSALPAPPVAAGPVATDSATKTAAQSTACAQRAWPYYGQDCDTGFDARWRGEPRKVRLVTTDRLH